MRRVVIKKVGTGAVFQNTIPVPIRFLTLRGVRVVRRRVLGILSMFLDKALSTYPTENQG